MNQSSATLIITPYDENPYDNDYPKNDSYSLKKTLRNNSVASKLSYITPE